MEISEDVHWLLDQNGGAIAGHQHPRLQRTLQRLAREQKLRAVLPGVFVRAADQAVPEIRIRAAGLWAPEAVVTGAAAARCTFWPETKVPVITLSSPAKRVAPRGYQLTRERLPRDLVRWQTWVWLTVPGLTALDLVATCGGAGIDRALLTRAASLADMREALEHTPYRHGNAQRRVLLHDSRDEPWSEAERLGHALVRASGRPAGTRTCRCGSTACCTTSTSHSKRCGSPSKSTATRCTAQRTATSSSTTGASGAH